MVQDAFYYAGNSASASIPTAYKFQVRLGVNEFISAPEDNEMEKKLLFRRARADEANALGEMTIAGVSYWGTDEEFPELVEDLRKNGLPTPDYIKESPVYVLEKEGQLIGFYGLEDREGYIEMRYLFLDTDYIGKGYGKKLWEHAVKEAKKSKFDRMRILSDPNSGDFYAAMGAKQEGEHVVKPGFVIGIFWFDL